LEVFSFNCLIY